MNARQQITIRYNAPVFTAYEAQAYVSAAARRLPKRMTWPNLRPLLQQRFRKGFSVPHQSQLAYLLWVLSPEFSYTESGLYLTDLGSRVVPTRAEVKRLGGTCAAEGGTNHIHLDEITRSRIGQFEIGVRAIRVWVSLLRRFSDLPGALIYLTGIRRFTLCVYSRLSDKMRREVEGGLEGGNCLQTKTADAFLRWALGVRTPSLLDSP